MTLLCLRQRDASGVAPLLLEALGLAGLDPAPAAQAAWLDFEVARLRDGAAAAERGDDPVVHFFYKQVGVGVVLWCGGLGT